MALALGQLWRRLAPAAIVISLRDRQDRRDSTDVEMARAGMPPEMVEFLLVDRHPTNTNVGIFESHTRAVQRGLELHPEARTVLIFEDDVAFGDLETLRIVLTDLCCMLRDLGTSWDHIRLGGMPCAPYANTDFTHVYRVPYVLCSHAYLLNRPFAERVAAQRCHGIAFDAEINAWSPWNQYLCYPMVAYQRDEASDNVHSVGYSVFTPLRELITHRRCMNMCQMTMLHMRGALLVAAAVLYYTIMTRRLRCVITFST